MPAAAGASHTPLFIDSAHGSPLAFAGLTGYLKLDGGATGNRFAAAYFPWIPPHRLAAPLHRHHNEDEYSFVLEGTLGTVIEDEVITATPGGWVVKPRGRWHTFFNPGDVACRMIEIVSPAGFERYFEEVAALSGRLDKLPELNARYAIDMDMASVAVLCDRFDLEFPQS